MTDEIKILVCGYSQLIRIDKITYFFLIFLLIIMFKKHQTHNEFGVFQHMIQQTKINK